MREPSVATTCRCRRLRSRLLRDTPSSIDRTATTGGIESAGRAAGNLDRDEVSGVPVPRLLANTDAMIAPAGAAESIALSCRRRPLALCGPSRPPGRFRPVSVRGRSDARTRADESASPPPTPACARTQPNEEGVGMPKDQRQPTCEPCGQVDRDPLLTSTAPDRRAFSRVFAAGCEASRPSRTTSASTRRSWIPPRRAGRDSPCRCATHP